MGSRSMSLHSFLTSASAGYEGFNFMFRPFCPQYPPNRRLWGAQSRSGRFKGNKNLLSLSEFEPPDRPPSSLVATPTILECSHEDSCTEKSKVLGVHVRATVPEHTPTHTSPRFVESGPKYGGQFSWKQNKKTDCTAPCVTQTHMTCWYMVQWLSHIKEPITRKPAERIKPSWFVFESPPLQLPTFHFSVSNLHYCVQETEHFVG